MKFNINYARGFALTVILFFCSFSIVLGQLTGVKTIPGDYATVTLAVNALNTAGVGTGGVTFNVAAGYTETITSTISLTASGTAANPIVFQKNPASTGADPLITAYTGGTATPGSTTQDGIWRLVGVDYVTIKAIDLRDNPANTTNPSTMEYGYALYKASTSNGCQFVTIQNCVITLNKINNAAGTAPMVDGSTGIAVMNALPTAATSRVTPISAAGTNSNNKFYGNTIQNCNTGIALIGYAASSPFTLADFNNDVGGSSATTGNTILNFGGAPGAANAAVGIRTLAQYSINISYNTLNSNNNNTGAAHPNTLRGIYVNTATSASCVVDNNTVTVIGGGTTQALEGIENDAGSTPASNTIDISNNTITNCTYSTATTAGFYGIFNKGTPATLTINNNVVSNNSSAATGAGFFYGIQNSGVANSVAINNNTFSGNSTKALTTGLFAGIYNSASVPAININGNTISGNTTTATTGVFNAIANKGTATTTININSNNIGTSTSPSITFTAANSGSQVLISNTKGGAAAALSISSNNIYNLLYSTQGTGSATFISNSAATLSQTIDNNTFTNMNVNTTNSITFITNSVVVPSGGSQDVSGNNISGTFVKSGVGGTLKIYTTTAASVSGSIINNNNNNFSNITVSGATAVTGWTNTCTGTPVNTIQGNTFSNWTCGTSTVTVMLVNIAGTNSIINNNAINNISASAAITGISTGAGSDKIYSNTINTLSSTGASAVNGINVTAGTTKNVYSNKIYDLQANAVGGTVNGILVSGSTIVSVNLYNNIIGDLRTPLSSAADPIRGISVTATAANATTNVYYNTIYLNATSSGATFGTTGIYHTTSTTATTSALNLRNNIVNNLSTPNGTGSTVAFRRSSATLTNYSSTSNNNLFYAGAAGTGHYIFFDGTNSDQLITTYKTRVSPRDALSVTEDLVSTSKFLSVIGSSANFLHIDPTQTTQVESGAVNVTGYTTDFDGDIRQGNTGYTGTNTAPDIGADEFNGIPASALAGTYNVGTGQTYTSLTGAGGLFAAINSLGLSADVVVNITSNLTEPGTNALFQWNEYGVGNYTLTIQPSASTLRTISGSVVGGMINFSGADRVTIDGSNGTNNNYLSFINNDASGTTGAAFTFKAGASNITINNCDIQAYANATTGVILFGTSTVAGGNSSNTISNCNINATVGANTGNVAIYSAGTVGNENSGNTISNNNISNYRDRGIDITATGSTGWTITGNSLFNGSVTGSINYAAASTLHGIRVLGGTGYSIESNYIGGSAALATGSNAVYSSSAGILSYQGILLTTTAATPASDIQSNVIAGLTVSAVPTATGQANVFIGIETNGSGISVGGTDAGDGNTIGSNTANSSIVINTSTSAIADSSIVRGINYQSTGGLIIGNQVGGIDIKNTGTLPGPSIFLGIYANKASAPPQINNNIIGSTGIGAASNSIRVLSSSTSTGTALTGILLGGAITSTVQVDGNIVQNLSNQTTTGAGIVTGISNAAISPATVSITNNTISANSTAASAGGFYGIASGSAPASLSIANNTVSSNSNTSALTGFLYGIYNIGATPSLSVNSNNVLNNAIGASTGGFAAIYNTAATPVLSILSNTVSGNSTSSLTGSFFAINNAGAATTSINIDNNIIGNGTTSAITYSAANSGTQMLINNSGGTSAATLSISNNNFKGISNTTAAIGDYYVINNTAATLSQAINGNFFTNLNSNTSGNFTFISDNVPLSATGTQNVNNNSIVTGFTKSAGATVTLFTTSATSASGSVSNTNNNNFSNITVSGATNIAGWVYTDAGSSTKTIQNNTFANWTAGTGSVTAMALNITGTNSITGNFVNNIAGGGAVTGISVGTGNHTVSSNNINTLSSSGAAAVTGLAITGGSTQKAFKNKIYGLTNSNATGTVNGVLVSGGTTVTVYNNLIGNLLSPAGNSLNDVIRGINITSTTLSSSVNIYYNTIYINATSTGTNFSTSGVFHTTSAISTTAALNLRNNSITNISIAKGSGATAAYRRSDATLTNYASTSNNNLFYGGTPSATQLIYYDGTNSDQTTTTFIARVTPRDVLSVSENLTTKFLSTAGSSGNFLHMDSTQPTLVESGAANISGITDDYDGQIRAGNTGYTGTSSSPDIGADEISGEETIPPTITYTLLANTTSTANRSVTAVTITDASGVNVATGTKPRIYYKRLSDANTVADNTASTNGWKYTEATNSATPFTFIIDYTLLYGGATVTAGVIQYFITAQDVAAIPNVAINSGTFAATPSSVALTTAAFPITGTINSYSIPFSGTYKVGSTEIFTTLTGAGGVFASINAAGLAGNTTFNITSDLSVEDGTNALNKWTEFGAGGYTLNFAPNTTTLRTVSGSATNGLITLSGANRVTFDGSSGSTSIFLSVKNTSTAGTTGTAFTFVNGASNNTIRYCDAEAVTNATNGVVLFGTSTVAGGNSSNTITLNTIKATVASTGSTGIYSAGTVGNENVSNTISSNTIFAFSNAGIDIAATGSSGWTITGNSVYNGNVSGSIAYPANSAINGIRILGGSGYAVLSNFIGGRAVGATGANAVYTSTLGNVSFQGILLTTTSATPASNIKGNTIAATTINSVPTSAGSLLFAGIETHGSGINIGGSTAGDKNLIGTNTANSSFVITTTTTSAANTSLIYGINCASTGGVVTANQVASFDISNVGSAPAPTAFTGIYLNSLTPPTPVSGNLIGSGGTGSVTNNIRFLAASASVTPSLTGVLVGSAVASPVQITGNKIQNISNLSTTSSGSFIGINNTAASSAAVMTITTDTVRTIGSATNASIGSTFFTGISSGTPSTISNNIISNISLASTGTAAQIRGISVSGPYAYTISNNTMANDATASTKTADIENGDPAGYNVVGILNSATVAGQVISGNSLSGFASTTTAATNTAVAGIAISTGAGSGNIFNNRVASFTNTATGTSTLPGIGGIVGNAGSYNVYNNAIQTSNSTNTNSVKIYGINDASSGSWYYFFNSVSLSGSSTGSARTAPFIRTATGTVMIKDNIFVNTRTGSGANYGISNIAAPAAAGWASGASNYNDLYSSAAGTTGEWGNGVNETFAQFQTVSAGDANSVNSTVSFVTSTLDLQPQSITNCFLSNGGTPITTPVNITTDILAASRSATTPDIGAYEFTYTSFTVVSSNSSPVCLGGTVDLAVDPGTAVSPTYSWRSPANTIVSTAQNPTVTPLAGWYKVTVTDANGCIAVDSTQVSLNTRPTAHLTGATSLCAGGSATLTLTVTGSGTISGSLNSGDTFSGTAPTITVVVTPDVTTSYAISDMADANCSSIHTDIPDTVVVAVTQTGSWIGVNGSSWTDPANWCGGVPGATTDVLIPSPSPNYPIISTGTNSINNLTVETGSSLTVSGATLQIAGFPTVYGSFVATAGTIGMTGTTAQTIPASTFSTNTINNLTINNSAGVTLNGTLNLTGVLLPTLGTFNTNGFLTLISSATQTALISGTGSGSVTGNVTMQRYLSVGYGYKYFSSPMQAATVNSFAATVDLTASFPNFYTYIENQASSGFTNYSTTTNVLAPMAGYAADFGSSTAAKTVSITGVVNNGTVTSTLLNHNQTYTQGFNLVGNPYPSPIDWNAATGWTKTNIDNAIYYFDSGTTSQYTGAYSTYINGVSSDGIASNIIASMQGFFVHVSNGTFPVTGTLATTNAVRVSNLSPVFHKSYDAYNPPQRLLLRLSANFADNVSSADPLVVYTDANATPAFNRGLDALKLMNIDDRVPNLYSVASDNTKLVINAQSTIDSLTVIPLGLQTSRNGIISFNLRDTEQWPDNLHIYFVDNKTNLNQDLQQSPDVNINLNAGAYEDRFSLRFGLPSNGVKPVIKKADVFNVGMQDRVVFIQVGLVEEQSGTLIISNINGQIIARKPITGNGDYQMEANVLPSVYLVSLVTAKGMHTRKISLVK